MQRVRWSMLLSHHAPSDYDRTWKVGSVHVCIRCLGVAVGTAATLGSWKEWSALPMSLFLIAAIPGVLDFTLHELGASASSGARRFITGLLFGFFAAALLRAVIETRLVQLVPYLSWFLLLQAASAVALKRSGRLDQLLKRYEEAAHVPQSQYSGRS